MDRQSLPNLNANLLDKYDNVFNFYFAKNINQLLPIFYNDLQFLDEEDEFMKRFYRKDEVPSRIQLLVNYFAKNRLLKEELPCLVNFAARKSMTKRVKRFGKLRKRLEEISGQWDDGFGNLFQQFLHSSRSCQMESSVELKARANISYETNTYDIFQSPEQQHKSLPMPKKIMSLEKTEEDQDISLQEPKHLVCNFDAQKKAKPQKKLFIDLNKIHLGTKQSVPSRYDRTYQKSRLPSEYYSPYHQSEQLYGHNQEQLRILGQYLQKKSRRQANQIQVDTQKDGLKFTNHNPMRRVKGQLYQQIQKGELTTNRDHIQYLKILERVSKKQKGPDFARSPDPYMKTKPKFRQEPSNHLNPSKIETLRHKALKLIGDGRELRQVRSTDHTYRNR